MTFKSFEALLEPDFRNTFQGSLLPGRGFHRMDVREHYDLIAAIQLPPDGDGDIQEMFDRAKNAVLYSWCAYELSILGQQYALAALEAALRKHYQPTRRTTLDPLMRRAVDEGVFPPRFGSIDGRQPWLARLRNFWAHGENSFGTPLHACETLRECASLIGALWSHSSRRAAHSQ